MKVPLLKLDEKQIFVYAGKLWRVTEVVTNTSDIIQHLKCRPFTETRRGTSTISSMFATYENPKQFSPETVVTILDTQLVSELERHG